mgnify:CR=1 FL=1
MQTQPHLRDLGFMLRWFEHSQVYHPSRTFDTTGRELGQALEEASFTAADGVRLRGWFYPADPASARADWAVLVCHGNGGNISHRLGLAAALLRCGVAVLLFDYRGYGRSAGRPSEEGTYRDAQAAHAWLRERGFAPARIVAYGESLGGGVASELARREPLGGLVLQSTFTSIPDLGRELFPWLPVRWISTIRYDTRSKLPHLRLPVMILHSRDDTLVRFTHAEANYAAANQPKMFWELAGDHNDSLDEPGRLTEGIEAFLRLLEARAGTSRD